MKLIDLIELLFKPLPSRRLVLEHYAAEPADSAAGKGWHFHYSDHTYEFVSVARVISGRRQGLVLAPGGGLHR